MSGTMPFQGHEVKKNPTINTRWGDTVFFPAVKSTWFQPFGFSLSWVRKDCTCTLQKSYTKNPQTNQTEPNQNKNNNNKTQKTQQTTKQKYIWSCFLIAFPWRHLPCSDFTKLRPVVKLREGKTCTVLLCVLCLGFESVLLMKTETELSPKWGD